MSIPVPPDSAPVARDVPRRPAPITDLVRAGQRFPMEEHRSAGVTSDPDDPDPYGAFLQWNKLFGRLRVRWQEAQPHNVTSTLRNRAKMVGWDPKSLKVVEEVTGLLTTLPRRCPGKVLVSKLKSRSSDPGAQTCPCSVIQGHNPDVWKGHLCPAESVRAYQHFVRYIRELEIGETDHVDIGMILDLVQLHLTEDRCTEDIQINGLYEDKTGVVAQKTGEVHYDRTANISVALREKCQTQRLTLYKRLVADRAEREKMRAARVKEKSDDKKTDGIGNMADLLSSIFSESQNRVLAYHPTPLVDIDSEALNADLVTSGEDDAEEEF